MLKDKNDRSVLKAAVKPICGAREVRFYDELEKSCNDRVLSELRQFVPEYRGTVQIPFRGKTINFIKLSDITHGMAEPCVIDVKMGKRTWDPQATDDKIAAEEQKYAACKQNLGFCIPGFQVYDIQEGRLRRFGKEYGKKLNPSSVKDGEHALHLYNDISYCNKKKNEEKKNCSFSNPFAALRIFLNGDDRVSKPLLRKFLAQLRSIQKWMQSQTVFRFYSSSLLLAYDAKLLKSHIIRNQVGKHTNSVYDTYVSAGPHNDSSSPNNNTNDSYALNDLNSDAPITDDMDWAHVKMIDFAHVFAAENGSLDSNYLFGIQNLVRLFEEFLDM